MLYMENHAADHFFGCMDLPGFDSILRSFAAGFGEVEADASGDSDEGEPPMTAEHRPLPPGVRPSRSRPTAPGAPPGLPEPAVATAAVPRARRHC